MKFILFTVLFLSSKTVLALAPNCRPSGVSRLWAQQASGLDLAQSLLEQNRIPRVSQIAIIDSGFDHRLLADLEKNSLFSVRPLNPSALQNPFDPVGHGTIVTGLIKGRRGLGGSVNSVVTMYSQGRDELDPSAVEKAVLRACREGSEIINISISETTRYASSRLLSISTSFSPETLREIRSRRCLIVHAAGNDGATNLTRGQDFEFEIAATDSFGELATFSNRGEFAMPGQRIISLHSTGTQALPPTARCGDATEGFESGTSFSAPLFTSHLALIRDVLWTSYHFHTLTREEQIDLFRDISRTSIVNNIVNSYLAVRLALEWVKHPAPPAELLLSLNRNCHVAPTSLINPRIYALECDNPDTRLQLAHALESAGDLEGASYWFKIVKDQWPHRHLPGPFPISLFRGDLVYGLNLAILARWMSYFQFRNPNATDDDHRFLEDIANMMRKNFLTRDQIATALKTADGTRDLLSVAPLLLKLDRNGNSLNQLMTSLRRTRYSQRALVQIILKAEKERYLLDDQMGDVLNRLTSSDSTPLDHKSMAELLQASSLSYQIKSQYLQKLLGLDRLPPDLFQSLSRLGLRSESPTRLEVHDWLLTLRALLESRHCTLLQAEFLAASLFSDANRPLNETLLTRGNPSEVKEVLSLFEGRLLEKSRYRAVLWDLKAKLMLSEQISHPLHVTN